MSRTLCILATILAGVGTLSNLAQDTQEARSSHALPDDSKPLDSSPTDASKEQVVFVSPEGFQPTVLRELITALETAGIVTTTGHRPPSVGDSFGVDLAIRPEEQIEQVKQLVDGIRKLGASRINLHAANKDTRRSTAHVIGFVQTPYEKIQRVVAFLAQQNYVKLELTLLTRINENSLTARTSDASSVTGETDRSEAAAEIRAIQLAHAQAGAVAELLGQLFRSQSFAAGVDQRTNSILVRGDAEILAQIEAVVKKLDQPSKTTKTIEPAMDRSSLNPISQSQIQKSESGPRDFRVDTFNGLRGFSGGTMTATAATAELKKQYEAEEQKATLKARQLRDLLAKGSAPEPRIAQLQTELRDAVAATFSARQQLHQVELAEFQSRALQIQRAIEQRSSIRDQIIDRRVEDLLQPDLRWDSDGSSGPTGAQGSKGLQGLKGPPAKSGSGGDGELQRNTTSRSLKTEISGAAIPLSDAVRAFNEKYADHPIGKEQPPLTDDEVVASIRWASGSRDDRNLSDKDFGVFETVAESRMLPDNVQLEVVTNFEEPDKSKLTMWSIRITEQRPDGTGATHLLRERCVHWQPAEGSTSTRQPIVAGQIVKVGAQDLLEISIGSDVGIKAGHTLQVFRGNTFLGRLVVRETHSNRSVGEIVPEFRKGTIKTGDSVSTVLVNSDSGDKNGRPLAAAIHGFNTQYRSHSIGKDQPPLTEEEVVAAIRHWITKRNEVDVSTAEFSAFLAIADTRVVPENVEFEVLTSFRPNDTFEFDAWSVRLVSPRTSKPGWTHAYIIRDRWIRSRRLDDREISWGPAASNGIQAGVAFDPRNQQYATGQQIVPRFYYRNVGSQEQSVAFPRLMTHSYYDGLRAVDDAGRDIAIDQDAGPGGPVGWIQMPLGPKSQHEIAGLPIVLGNVPRESGIETVIRALPGQSCRVRFTVPNYGAPKSAPLQTGEIIFTIVVKR